MLTIAKSIGSGTPGDILKHFRIEKNMTLRQLSEKTGLTQSAISKYENNKRKPSINIFFKLLEALGTDIYIMHK